MEILGNILHYAVAFIAIISIVVFIHEWGHFIVARLCGVKVVEFSIGFGKKLFGWQDKKGTQWKVCLLPFGGFVKMFGDETGASNPDVEKLKQMPEEQKRQSFYYKALWQKALIVIAGPFMNFVLSVAIFMGIFMFVGKLQMDAPPLVNEVVKGGAAEQIGIKAGDLILKIDGKDVKYFSDLQEIIRISPLEEMDITYKRGEQIITTKISPKFEEIDDGNGNKVRIGMIGIARAPLEVTDKDFKRLGVTAAFSEAANEVYKQCKAMLKGLKQIITGVRSTKELGGPVKIMEYSGQSTNKLAEAVSCTFDAKQKDCSRLYRDGIVISLVFTAMISTMLGLMNLFPIPVLDGGHLLFYTIEAIMRRPAPEKVQEWSFRAGFAFLIGMMLYVTFNDITSFVQRYLGNV